MSPRRPAPQSRASRSFPAEAVVPDYGRATLADVLPSVGAHLGVPGCDEDVLGLPSASRYVILLVDGLGWTQLSAHLSSAAYFADLIGDARAITAGVPSTTATSITSLGTGLVPGAHGVMGYLFRPAIGQGIMNGVTWEGGPDPRLLQPNPTLFERAAAAGVAVTSVVPSRFEASGLTLAALRGARVAAVANEADLAARRDLTLEASGQGERSLVYVYERELDHTGHGRGVASVAWRSVLSRVSAFAEDLREHLGDDVCLLVTGDHGMIDVPRDHRVMLEDDPELVRGLDDLGGEGRFRQLYTRDPAAVASRWQRRLGPERAWVLSRDEAVAAGWFGGVHESVSERIGDVLVAMRSDWAVMTRTLPGENSLIGMHGSLSPDEMIVPLLVDHPDLWHRGDADG